MKRSPEEIEYCLKNRDLVARWLEQRGGLKDGDQVYTEDPELSHWSKGGLVTTLKDAGYNRLVTYVGISCGRSTDYVEIEVTSGGIPTEIAAKSIWLPSVGDVLEMLERQINRLRQEMKADWLRIEYDSADQSKPWRCHIDVLTQTGEETVVLGGMILAIGRRDSCLIMLMELLKLCDSTAS